MPYAGSTCMHGVGESMHQDSPPPKFVHTHNVVSIQGGDSNATTHAPARNISRVRQPYKLLCINLDNSAAIYSSIREEFLMNYWKF